MCIYININLIININITITIPPGRMSRSIGRRGETYIVMPILVYKLNKGTAGEGRMSRSKGGQGGNIGPQEKE